METSTSTLVGGDVLSLAGGSADLKEENGALHARVEELERKIAEAPFSPSDLRAENDVLRARVAELERTTAEQAARQGELEKAQDDLSQIVMQMAQMLDREKSPAKSPPPGWTASSSDSARRRRTIF
jgi:chromosome segregation ATPase